MTDTHKDGIMMRLTERGEEIDRRVNEGEGGGKRQSRSMRNSKKVKRQQE